MDSALVYYLCSRAPPTHEPRSLHLFQVPVEDSDFLRVNGGFSFFGEAALEATFPSPFTVTVTSEVLHMLTLPGHRLHDFLGHGPGLQSEEQLLDAVKTIKALNNVPDDKLKALLKGSTERTYNVGDVLAEAGKPCSSLFLVKSGAVMVKGNSASSSKPDTKLMPGQVGNTQVLTDGAGATLSNAIIAVVPSTVMLTISGVDASALLPNAASAAKVCGGGGGSVQRTCACCVCVHWQSRPPPK